MPPHQDHAGYVSFWDEVGATFPSLKGAASTRYYAQCERRLLGRYFPPLAGRRLFKTDLWDEAKNTGWLVGPFAWLDRHVPAVHRHGYLIACVVEKPAGPAAATRARAIEPERVSAHASRVLQEP